MKLQQLRENLSETVLELDRLKIIEENYYKVRENSPSV